MMWNDSMNMLKSFSLNRLFSKQPDICPECGAAEKHTLLFRFDEEDDDGGVWMWCSKCHSYTHARAQIPPEWENPEFIDEEQLDDSVDYLESNKEKIDEWMNKYAE